MEGREEGREGREGGEEGRELYGPCVVCTDHYGGEGGRGGREGGRGGREGGREGRRKGGYLVLGCSEPKLTESHLGGSLGAQVYRYARTL